MKKYLFVFLILPLIAIAQQSKIDSLLSLLKTDKEDTNKVNHLNALSNKLRYSNPDTAIILGNQALSLSQQNKSKKHIANALEKIAWANYFKGNYPASIENNFKALKIREELGDKSSIAKSLSSIGTVYNSQSDFPKAFDYYIKALKLAEELGDKKSIAIHLCNIGNVYNYQADGFKVHTVERDSLLKRALDYYFKGLKMDEEHGDKDGIAGSLCNIGEVYADLGDNSNAMDYYFRALKLAEEVGNKNSVAAILGNIGDLYAVQNKFMEAEKYLLEAIVIDKEIGALNYEMDVENRLSNLYEKSGREKLALEHYKRAMVLKDTLFNQEKNKEITRKEMNFEFDKREALTKAEFEADKKQQKIVIWSVAGGLLLVLVFAGFIFRSLRITSKQKQIIEVKNKETEQQKHIIEEKNKDITDSINYARRIQRAMLPHRRDIWASFPQSFVLYKPKDIVSGDFYFFHNDKRASIIAAADCTGHGVPGAFMSLIASEKLKDAVQFSLNISEVLAHLNVGIKTSLKQSGEDDKATRDGMDIAICSVDTENRIVKYAGANRPIWIIRKGSTQVEEIKATKKAIGGFTENDQHFDTHEIKLQDGDTFYLSTDGYADTFGKDGKKMMTKRFKDTLLSIQDKTMKEQEKHLDDFVENWKAGTEQVDDILVIGIRM